MHDYVSRVLLCFVLVACASEEPDVREPPRPVLFDEPVIVIGATTADEDRALVAALDAYLAASESAGARDVVAPLVAFVAAHPRSAWTPGLLVRLGAIYRQTGHISLALDVWQEAWDRTKQLADRDARIVADSAGAQLAQLLAYLGRTETLELLVAELLARPLGGTAAELVSESSRALANMRERPEAAFKCGPLALYRIRLHQGTLDRVAIDAVFAARSSPRGLAMTAVRDLAHDIAMPYQLAYRARGAEVVVPAVMHWRAGHYAAIVDRAADRFVIEDSTFGEGIRLDTATIDDEASGYFLIPAGPLPAGWRAVSDDEGATVWGRGDTGDNRDNGATGPCETAVKPCAPGEGITTWNVQAMVVGLELEDTPIGYRPALGPPVRFRIVYAHRDALQPAQFTYTNLGPKWTTTWLSYIVDNASVNGTAMLYGRGGGAETFALANDTSGPSPFSRSVLRRLPTGFVRELRDGSAERFERAHGAKFFLTSVSDPRGHTVTLDYDAQMRLVTLTDALGQITKLGYEHVDPLKVTSVTDPFGRVARFTYTPAGQLASITDALDITSSYTYGPGDFVNALTTPYGTTKFTFEDSTTNGALGSRRVLTAVDALGRTTRVEFRHAAPGIGGSDAPATLPTGIGLINQYLHFRNTFVWTPAMYEAATAGGGLDYTKARRLHWLHTNDASSTARVLESIVEPSQSRIWFEYPNQPGPHLFGNNSQPTAVARTLDDGKTQLHRFEYDALGNLTKRTDPVGRTVAYAYAGIDLISVHGGADRLGAFSYGARHRPTEATDASGQRTTIAYDARGLPTQVIDALGRTTTLTYDERANLTKVERPVGAVETFTYDALGRVATLTDAGGLTTAYEYDAADRVTRVGYGDGTSASFTYKLLDLVAVTDERGKTFELGWDAERQLAWQQNPAGHRVQATWGAGGMTSLIEASGAMTTVERDLLDRVVRKTSADGGVQTFVYEATTSRVRSVTDAKNQTTVYAYNADDTIASVRYENAQQPTPAVQFAYDPKLLRITQMSDGNGTTTYAYVPIAPPLLGAGQLAQVTQPIAGGVGRDVIAMGYDALGRVTTETIDGSASTYAYDELDRVRQVASPLDTFTYSYLDATRLVTAVASRAGVQTAQAFYDVDGARLPRTLAYEHPKAGELARYEYTYEANQLIATFKAASLGGFVIALLVLGGLAVLRRRRSPLFAILCAYVLACGDNKPRPDDDVMHYTYDDSGQLVAATSPTGGYAYSYDAAGNITSIARDDGTATLAYDLANRLTTATYDANGNVTSIGDTHFTWDAADRLVAITRGAQRTEYSYDGLSRMVRIVVAQAGEVVSDRAYLWCGPVRCIERDNLQPSSPITKRYFEQGVTIDGEPYYYVRDLQGSVRQLVDANGAVRAKYDYDPFGNQTQIAGDLASDVTYAGYFHDDANDLHLTVLRAYSPKLGRWLNRDPIGIAGGINQYRYAANDPINMTDPNGTVPWLLAVPALIGGVQNVATCQQCKSWDQYAGAFAIGAASGVVTTVAVIGLGPGGALLPALAIGATSNWATQYFVEGDTFQNGKFSWGKGFAEGFFNMLSVGTAGPIAAKAFGLPKTSPNDIIRFSQLTGADFFENWMAAHWSFAYWAWDLLGITDKLRLPFGRGAQCGS